MSRVSRIRQQANSGDRHPVPMTKYRRKSVPSGNNNHQEEGSFKEFTASELYCTRCKKAMPVREKLLLFLMDGSLYDYLCVGCGHSLGQRKG